MHGRGPNFCWLGQVDGLLFCIYVNPFLPSIFNSLDFSSNNTCIVPVTEQADVNVLKELEVFLMGMFRDTNFFFQKSTKQENERFDVQET